MHRPRGERGTFTGATRVMYGAATKTQRTSFLEEALTMAALTTWSQNNAGNDRRAQAPIAGQVRRASGTEAVPVRGTSGRSDSGVRDGSNGGWPDGVAHAGRLVAFERHDILHAQGDVPTDVRVVFSGKVLREHTCRDGAKVLLDVHAKGDVLGVTGFLDGTPHPDSAVAHTRGVALVIPVAGFRQLIQADLRARTEFEHQIARRYRHDVARAAALTTDRVEARIRQVLVGLAERFGVWGDVRGLLLDLGLTRAELASLCGTTLETVIRTVNRLRDQGTLDTDGRKFFLKDLDALRHGPAA